MDNLKKKNIKIIIADDSSVIRSMVFEMLEKEEDITVVGAVENGEVCLRKLEQQGDVDIVTLDIDMPGMDGLTTLKHIMRRFPEVKVIILSSLTQRGSKQTFDALSMGASDFITKPTSRANGGPGLKDVRELLLEKIRALAPKPKRKKDDVDLERIQLKETRSDIKPEIILIGSSTGGPDALTIFFNRLSIYPDLILPPVLIAQHMPALFTKHLADRLRNDSGYPCKEGANGERVVPGTVYVAPGDYHMLIKEEKNKYVISLNQEERVNFCRPAVDPLFESGARIFGPRVLGVILTGMGHDGCKGSQEIVKRGGAVIAQDEASSVVWGMPEAVAAAGIASALLPADQLADYVKRRIS